MEWFRFYHEALNDPKVQRLKPELFKHWINMLCLSSMQTERGTVPSIADVAFGFRLPESKVRAIFNELMGAGLIDRDGETLRMHNWGGRQKRSDDVTARVSKHRAGNDVETLQETFPETFHETEPETLPHVRVKNRAEQNRADTEEIPPKSPDGGETTKPWDLLETLCSAIGSDPSELTKQDKAKQLEAAKRLIENQVTPGDIRAITGWLLGQSWLTGGVDFLIIEKQIGKWRLNGKPSEPPSKKGHTASRSITADHAGEDRAYLERGLPPIWGSANGGIDSL